MVERDQTWCGGNRLRYLTSAGTVKMFLPPCFFAGGAATINAWYG